MPPVAGPDTESAPVGGPALALTAGLFGKLPAHGDFVRRGWSDETVEAIDRWLSDTVDAARATRDEAAFDAWMRAAPLWRGFVPAGKLGPEALHLAVAPSIDRAGRLFPIAAGVSGHSGKVWRHAGAAGAALDDAIYEALAGRADADATVDAIGGDNLSSAEDAPARSAWWLHADGEPLVTSETVDAALLERLMGEGQEVA